MIKIGDTFGRLTVIEQADSTKQGRRRWECRCDCGNIVVVRGNHLVSGNTKSCGCLSQKILFDANAARAIPKSELKFKKRLRNIRDGMLKRCYQQNRADYKYYGGRGITICDEWKKSFQTFYQWAINNGYSENLTLDRIDNDGNYDPNNCRWATATEQSRNRRCCKH